MGLDVGDDFFEALEDGVVLCRFVQSYSLFFFSLVSHPLYACDALALKRQCFEFFASG